MIYDLSLIIYLIAKTYQSYKICQNQISLTCTNHRTQKKSKTESYTNQCLEKDDMQLKFNWLWWNEKSDIVYPHSTYLSTIIIMTYKLHYYKTRLKISWLIQSGRMPETSKT